MEQSTALRLKFEFKKICQSRVGGIPIFKAWKKKGRTQDELSAQTSYTKLWGQMISGLHH